MEISIPVYVEKFKRPRDHVPVHRVRPLFNLNETVIQERLQTAMGELGRQMRKRFVELAKERRHDLLLDWTHLPQMTSQQIKVRIEAGGRAANLRLLVVQMIPWGTHGEPGRRVAFTPTLPGLWFDLRPGEELQGRLLDVLTEYVKRQWKSDPREGIAELERNAIDGSAWLSELEVSLTISPWIPRPDEDRRMFLGCCGVIDGADELQRVGTCLNHQYPDDLERASHRETEVTELRRLLRAEDRRPLVLLGRPQSGKTTVLHEYVFQKVRDNKHRGDRRGAVWHISPLRLISGMSYVGQWEERFHQIVKHARRYDLVLYFDDLLGLFEAGITSQSLISVGMLLKEELLNRRLRVVVEQTPEAWRVLRERDRAFADLFHVIPLPDLDAERSLRVLISQQRELEYRHRVRFTLDVIPTVIDLQRRYYRDLAFPGKAVSMLRRLAVRMAPQRDEAQSRESTVVPRQAVLEQMQIQSGLSLTFLDQQQTVSAAEVEARLRDRFVGQPAAVAAAVQVIGIARARLNDPTRPLASLLLLGPTGVGKTEFAKSLATYLFGSPDRLVRFDMNEFVTAQSVPLLTGTFARPEGLLTSAVRRQPFAVLLFDEIEKGHPDVLDLLLQVLGEGRLTDARGRTTDFTQTLIVLTSNLGTRSTDTNLGFGGDSAAFDHSPVRVAEAFFRPEFFNRLDRVIPFARLSRKELQLIARHLVNDVLRREGLARRQCVLETSPQAAEWIVDQADNPAMGARALKRALERELTQPIARFLAVNPPLLPAKQPASYAPETPTPAETPTPVDLGDTVAAATSAQRPPADKSSSPGEAIAVGEAVSGGRSPQADVRSPITLITVDRGTAALQVLVRQLEWLAAGRMAERDVVEEFPAIRREIRDRLQEVRRRLPELKTTSSYDSGALTPAQVRYLLVQQESELVRRWLEDPATAAFDQGKNRASPTVAVPVQLQATLRREPARGGRQDGGRPKDTNLRPVVQEIDEYLLGGSGVTMRREAHLASPRVMLARMHWISRVAEAELNQLDETVVLQLRSLSLSLRRQLGIYVQRLREAWNDELWLETSLDESASEAGVLTLTVTGVLAREATRFECGYHLVPGLELAVPGLFSVQNVDKPDYPVMVRELRFRGEIPELVSPTVRELQCEPWLSPAD